MSYTPLVRWRNFTLENLKSILSVYPDMTSDLKRSRAVDIIEERLGGYKRTAYQFACQLGLESRTDRFRVQNYLFTFDDDNLKKYLNFWFKMYVTPNPYVNSSENPISIFKSLAEEILSSENKQISFNSFCTKYFGDGKSSDILKNAIQAYGNPIIVNDDILYLPEGKIDELNSILSKVNDTLPMRNNMDIEEFFNRFSYEQFCIYYDIPYSRDLLENLQNTDTSAGVDNQQERVIGGTNTLLYGVPGSGKSYTIETNYCNDFSLMERVVFHPDYMNTDFVGQILPTVKGTGEEKEITYDFTPGPFTRVLNKAIKNPDKHYYLVIEEINRGNAPAIFGEIFQLLDRESDGASSYKITNYNIAGEVFGEKETPVFIPSNLSILATMNTADQNVFTLDTAFQRRWNMKMIENDVTKAEHAKTEILNTTVTWEKFNTVINDQIITSGTATLSSEDKRLGSYFVTKDVLKYFSMETHKEEIAEKNNINLEDVEKIERVIKDLNSRFGDKVIKYLWDDVFKFSRDDLFESTYKSLEKVLYDFNRFNGNRRFDIFKQDIKDNLFSENSIEETRNE